MTRLPDLLAAGPLEAERAIRIIIGVCKAVPRAERPGALAPYRIAIDGDDVVTIGPLDFAAVGFGYVAPEIASTSGLVVSERREQVVEIVEPGRHIRATTSGVHRWTPEGRTKYAALEPCATVFVVGAILWEMLAGRPLFAGDTDYATLVLAREANIPAHPIAPFALDAIVRKALAKQPADRYPTVGELGAALDAYLGAR